MNLTLIGMAGAGKSYLGSRLAEQLGLEFVDSDELLSSAFGKPIQSILDELGEEKYVATEAKMNIEDTTNRDKMLISPSGSVIYSDDWIGHLKGISTVVYLEVPFETIEARLTDVPPRAIIGLGRKTLRELYDERTPLYERHAHLTVDTEKLSPEEIIQTITSFLSAQGKTD